MIAALLFCAWWTGGVTSPVLVFMSIVPLLPVYTTRNRTWVFFGFLSPLSRSLACCCCNSMVLRRPRRCTNPKT